MIRLLSLSLLFCLLSIPTAHALLGDTLVVAQTWVDEMHPGMMAPSFLQTEGSGGDLSESRLVFARADGPTAPLLPWSARVLWDQPPQHWTLPLPVPDGSVLDERGSGVVRGLSDSPILVHQARINGTDPAAWLTRHIPFIGAVDHHRLPIDNVDLPVMHMPRAVSCQSGEDEMVIHAVTRGAPSAQDSLRAPLHYTRSVQTDDGLSNDVFNNSFYTLWVPSANPSHAIAVSPDGQHVAVAAAMGRSGEQEGETGWHPRNNDLCVWTSDDGGMEWSIPPEYIVSFEVIDSDLLPDTLAACRDTMRFVSDVDLVVEDDGTVHAAFVVSGWYGFYTNTMDRPYTTWSRLYYWNSQDEYYIQIADGSYDNNTSDPAEWEATICNPQLTIERTTGMPWNDVFWCSWVQYGEAGLTDDNGAPLDASDEGIQATDIYVTAGTYHGRLWDRHAVNITNTRTLQTDLPPGETASEREMTMVVEPDGDLYFSYIIDRDPGIAVPAADPVGEPTANDVAMHRVDRDELLSLLPISTWLGWGEPVDGFAMPNYPLRVDSTGWYDPFDLAVEDMQPAARPDDFVLEPAWPNPFNATTRVAFTLPGPDRVRVTLYDLLGREVMTLADRGMRAGRHEFMLHGAEQSSGVYLLRVNTRQHGSQTQKLVLVK